MYKLGMKFVVVKNGIVGEITGYESGIYSVAFSNNDGVYAVYSVYEGTIRDNLRIGNYKEI